jgi:hypothetical protein
VSDLDHEYFTYTLTVLPDKTSSDVQTTPLNMTPVDSNFRFKFDAECMDFSKCNDTGSNIIYQLWLSHYFLNSDNELV